jgi:PAS domain S-box-containing protein
MGEPSWEFMPHGHFYLWTPSLVWSEVVANFLIGLAYLSISLTLARIVRSIKDLPFQRLYGAFGIFIVSCGLTHFFDVITVWYPIYWVDSAVRIVTAVASVGTAVLLMRIVPKAVALANAASVAHARGLRLQALNEELASLTERTRREYHRVIAETVPQKVWVTNAEGTAEYVNTRWTEDTGQDLNRLLEEGWTAVVHPDDRGKAAEAWKRAITEGEPYAIEYRLRAADGSYRWHLARALPVRQNGDILRWVGTTTDIDDQKRASEERAVLVRDLREAVRARDEFLSIASHELRTPVTTIGLQADAMARGASQEAPRLVERCAIVKRQAERLEALVGTLLEVSRFAVGRVALEPEIVDLAAIARDVAADMAARSGPEQEIHVEAEPVAGRWDRVRLLQVATNLLSNAVKYGEGRPIEVRVRAEQDSAVLEVVDHGIGIPPDARDRIFDRFERAVSERHYGGLGLGLWITREIVRAMSGSIAFESELGKGSTFTVRLPRGTHVGP